MSLQTGQVLNSRYRIVKLLGQGGFGAVYRAWDSNLNKPCAVKENLDTSPEAQRQFTREATVLANLSHPNLPRVTDHFILPGQGQYLVMDFVDGDDLATILRQRGAVPVQQAVVWISQVADALAYLHSRQPVVVHRDVKPANIRVTPEGRAMLVDFGLVKVYTAQLKTTMGARAVTPGYAPPEQYGQGSTDARSDIYALGATLHNLLTGQDPLESVQRMSGDQMKPVHQINPSVPITIGHAIERSMRLEPNQRYQDVREFKAAVNAQDTPVIVRPVPEAYAVPAVRAPAVEPVVRTPISRPKPAQKRGMGMWIGIGGVVLLCIFGSIVLLGLYAASQNGDAEATSEAELRATLADRVKMTSTAQAMGTAEIRMQVTQTAFLSYVESKQRLVYGPNAGSLEHNEGESIVAVDADLSLRDFVVEARFFNPYAASEAEWDCGFILRHEAKNVQFRFVIDSERNWILINYFGESAGETIMQGNLPDLNINAGGSNLVKLIFQGNLGRFYLNDMFISDLDLSARMNPGEIYIATGIFQGSKQAGSVTKYTDFRVWSLH